MSVPLRHALTLALCGLLLPLAARAQALLPAVSFRTVADVQFDMWPADLNGDGMTDVVALGPSGLLQVWIGNGNGTFRAPIVSSAHVQPMATGDVNGDGNVDVIGAFLFEHTRRQDLVVLPGRGDGTFSPPIPISPSGGGLAFAVLAHLDNDSSLDVLGGYFGETTDVVIWPGNGDFTFDAQVSVVSGGEGPLAAFVTDVNGDRLLDVAVPHVNGGVWLLTNKASFTFTASPVPSGSGRPTDVTARDVNGDGAVDLLISGRFSPFFDPPYTYGYVFVAVGNGKGTFTSGGEYPSGRGANSVVFGDFTRDGVGDVATLNHSYWITQSTNCFRDLSENANSVSILKGRGDGTFSLPTTFAVDPQRGDPSNPYNGRRLNTLNTSDLNRDRFPDLLVGDGKILLPVAPRANRAPTAFAGNDYRTTNSAEMLLNGTGTDPDGHFLEFQWTGGAGGTLLEGDQPLACYQEPTATGRHAFTLTVSDGHGGVDSDDLAIYLVRPPRIDILAPAAGEVVPAGQPYTIRWTATSEDPLRGFLLVGERDGGRSFQVEGCANLPPTARQCTWTNTAPTADAQIRIEAVDVGGQVGTDSSGHFVIGGGGPVPTGWQNRDIGAVGAPGRASFTSGVFSVTGSGADIWGTADEFHYAYTTASRDFEIVARVASVQNIDQWAKAGVMIREGTSSRARHASLFITPTTVNGVAFQRRPRTGGASVHTSGPRFTTPGWVRLVRDHDTVTAYYREFPGHSWQLIGTQAFSGLAETLLVGLAVSSHADPRLANATFDNVMLTSDQFQSADIGAVGVPGTTRVNSASVTLEGSGTDIWGRADAFRYHHQPWTGDGTIAVRVASIENTNVWAKAGVMFRETLAANSRQVMAIVSPGNGVALQYRGTTGGSSANVALSTGTAPQWLRLTRSGNLFTAAASEDGTTWRTLGSITVAMPSSLFVGLPVTSHNNAALATGVFNHPLVGP